MSTAPRALPPGQPLMPDDQLPTSRPPAASTSIAQLPRDEMENLAEDYGLVAGDFRTRQHLALALQQRRELIGTMDRKALLGVLRWGRRAVRPDATLDQLAKEIVRIHCMKFHGLEEAELRVLAQLRGIALRGSENRAILIHKLKKQEGLFARWSRKRRAWLGKVVSNMIGDEAEGDYRYLPQGNTTAEQAPDIPGASLRHEIEEAGLIGGIAGRIRRTADEYLKQKLDEIEQRIDLKLDEIDRRLGEWRDKEIANRLRIIKVTLWASVIVAALSLIYSYVKVYFLHH